MKNFSANMYQADLAQHYDLMRTYRDYDKECRFADLLIKQRLPEAAKVLDLCCGTGEHAVRMAQKGYEVTGVDQSQEMLDIAGRKAAAEGLPVAFLHGDVHALDFKQPFDAAYCLGYTFHYMKTFKEATSLFTNVRDNLSPDGVFLVDFFNGYSLITGFNDAEFTYQHDGTNITQQDRTHLDKKNRIKHLDYEYTFTDPDGRVRTITAEEDLRIFFEDEVTYLLEQAGFTGIEIYGDHALQIIEGNYPTVLIMSGQKRG